MPIVKRAVPRPYYKIALATDGGRKCARLIGGTSVLENWAAWLIGGSGVRMGGVSRIYRLAPATTRARADTTFVVIVGDAIDVNDLVVRLTQIHQRALVINYCWSGSLVYRAHEAGLWPSTLRDRIEAVKKRLQELDEARRHAHRPSL
jgi:hypothetical protein